MARGRYWARPQPKRPTKQDGMSIPFQCSACGTKRSVYVGDSLDFRTINAARPNGWMELQTEPTRLSVWLCRTCLKDAASSKAFVALRYGVKVLEA